MGLIGCLAFVAICGGQTSPQDSQALAHLDKLLKLYKELDLPFPPADAPLKRREAGWRVKKGKEVSIFSVGYLLNVDKDSNATFMVGTSEDHSSFPDEIQAMPPLPLNATTAQKVEWSGFNSTPFREDESLALSLIERARGHNEFATAMWKRAQAMPLFRNSLALNRLPSFAPSAAESRLKVLALTHWLNEIVNPSADRTQVRNELEALIKRNPELRTPFVDQTSRQLKLSVNPRNDGSNEIEKLIDGLCKSRQDGRTLSSPDPSKREEFEPLIELASKGYAAIPKLIEHADDERLTCVNVPDGFFTVGDICQNLAEQFKPSRRPITIHHPAKSRSPQKAAFHTEEVRTRILCSMLDFEWTVTKRVTARSERSFPDLIIEAYDKIV